MVKVQVVVVLLAVACQKPADHVPDPGAHLRPGPPDNPAIPSATAPPDPDDERAGADHKDFAISARGDTGGFFAGYTNLFREHKPVYITADALLHAWHTSYDDILSFVEDGILAPTVTAMLADLRTALAASQADRETRADVDVYLAVAYALITDKTAAPVAGGDADAIAQMVGAARAARGEALVLAGRSVAFDFSQFTPRGHYVGRSEPYFRAMIWLGTAELQLASRAGEQAWRVDRRVLRATALLASLFDDKSRAAWTAIDRALAAFIGPSDSMSLPGLAVAQTALQRDLLQASDAELVAALRGPATQRIRSGLRVAGEHSLAFVLIGQRYVFDAHVLSDLTYDTLQTQPRRLMATPLDIGDAVFGNPAARRLLRGELKRYGAPFEAALDAVRTRAAASDPELWDGSLHHMWLGALRALSPDDQRDASLPAPLNTFAWSKRMLAAQLASWAELRHDNALYVKQSSGSGVTCEYPAAYIDPYPAFYAALAAIAERGKATIAALPPGGATQQVTTYFEGMATTMGKLRAIAERERANLPMTADDLDFINHMVSSAGQSVMCGQPAVFGWYGDLFITKSNAVEQRPVISDVHTQPTDENGARVGYVLHVASGWPRELEITVEHDRGAHRQTYYGYVSTYSEQITAGFQRLTDQQWESQADHPPQPRWLTALERP